MTVKNGQQDGEEGARHRRLDREGDLDVHEPQAFPDDQGDREQPGDDADAMPHADAGRADAVESRPLNQLKNETIRNAIVPPSTSFAPCESFEMSILRTFLSWTNGGLLAFCHAI